MAHSELSHAFRSVRVAPAATLRGLSLSPVAPAATLRGLSLSPVALFHLAKLPLCFIHMKHFIKALASICFSQAVITNTRRDLCFFSPLCAIGFVYFLLMLLFMLLLLLLLWLFGIEHDCGVSQ